MVSGLGIDQQLSRTDSAGARYPLTDALGSVIALADSIGTLQTQYTYEPFGKTTVTGSSSANNYRYTGREDDGTGLYFYRARYYSPSLQRFISEDPIGFGGEIPISTATWTAIPSTFAIRLGSRAPLPVRCRGRVVPQVRREWGS